MPKKTAPRIYNEADPFQREVRTTFDDLSRKPLLNGREFTGITLSATATKVSHGLGRVPRGWILTDISVATTVHRVSKDSRYLTLTAGADCTVSLWIY